MCSGTVVHPVASWNKSTIGNRAIKSPHHGSVCEVPSGVTSRLLIRPPLPPGAPWMLGALVPSPTPDPAPLAGWAGRVLRGWGAHAGSFPCLKDLFTGIQLKWNEPLCYSQCIKNNSLGPFSLAYQAYVCWHNGAVFGRAPHPPSNTLRAIMWQPVRVFYMLCA